MLGQPNWFNFNSQSGKRQGTRPESLMGAITEFSAPSKSELDLYGESTSCRWPRTSLVQSARPLCSISLKSGPSVSSLSPIAVKVWVLTPISEISVVEPICHIRLCPSYFDFQKTLLGNPLDKNGIAGWGAHLLKKRCVACNGEGVRGLICSNCNLRD